MKQRVSVRAKSRESDVETTIFFPPKVKSDLRLNQLLTKTMANNAKNVPSSERKLKQPKKLFPGLLTGTKLLRFKRFITLTLCVKLDSPLDAYLAYANNRVRECGVLYTMKHLKDLYNLSLRFSAGQVVPILPFLATDSDNFPYCIKQFKKYLVGTVNEKRAALAALSLWRNVLIEGPYSVKSITDKGLVEACQFGEEVQVGSYFQKIHPPHVSEWKKILEVAFPTSEQTQRLKSLGDLSSLHVSAKSGPNGPAVYAAAVDWNAISKDMKGTIKGISTLTNHKDLLGLMRVLPTEECVGALHSKISLKTEPGGKMRPFAICDWFSQSALKSLHTYLFRWLKDQPEDGTFSHNACAVKAQEWTKRPITDSEVVYSSDLSTATDRFPRDLQAEVICQMFGGEFSKLWRKLVADRTFTLPDNSEVRYSVGQPMGILSSWAILAVSHHLIARLSYTLVGERWTGKFLIIGDDIATRGRPASQAYQRLMVDCLGVTVSKEKSFDPFTPRTSMAIPLHSCEIAKRVFINGEEITPIPPQEIIGLFGGPSGLTKILSSLVVRGWSSGHWEVPAPSLALLGDKPEQSLALATFPITPAPHYVGVTKCYLGSFNQGFLDRSYGSSYLAPWWSYPPSLIESNFSGILRSQVVDAFKETRAMFKRYSAMSKSLEPIKVSRWQVSGKALGIILSKVAQNGLDFNNSLMGGLLKANIPCADLRRELARVMIFIDLSLILKGGQDFRDEKKKTDKFLYRIQAKVLKRIST